MTEAVERDDMLDKLQVDVRRYSGRFVAGSDIAAVLLTLEKREALAKQLTLSDTNEGELKACPFCGSEPVIQMIRARQWMARCGRACDVNRYSTTKALCIAAWNTRASRPAQLTDEQIKHMANRFCAWPLPEHFTPDNGISYTRPNFHPSVNWEAVRPVGTNLFNADQAETMVRFMIEGLPLASRPSPPSNEEVERALVAAYREGARDVHNFLAGLPDDERQMVLRDDTPDLTEAAHTYARAALSAMKADR